VLSQFTRGAHCFPTSVFSRRAPRSFFGSFGIVSFALLLFFWVCAPLQARGQNQTSQQDQTQQDLPQASSSSSQTAQETLETRRGFENRRQQTRQRREAQLITDTYTHRWEVYGGGEYMRFRPGPHIHNSGMGGWVLGLSRYFTPRFAITADARGDYGSNSLGPVNGGGFNVYNAKFSVFPFTIGPQYRFYGSPKFSVSGAIQGGAVYGYFDAHTNGIPPQLVGFYPAGIVAGGIASIDLDYNLGPSLALRVAPHVLFDHFGGNLDHNQGLLVGLVYRFGRQ
jgi:hypothetical protein